MMKREYRLLITNDVFEALRKTLKHDRESVKKFLDYLISGEWEKGTEFPVEVWKQTGEVERYVFSSKLKGIYAVWEAVWSINLTFALGKPTDEKIVGGKFSSHIILHKFGESPSREDILHLKPDEDFQRIGGVGPKHRLTLHDREAKDEVKYDEELYYLSPRLIKKVLAGEQRGLLLQMPEEQLSVFEADLTSHGPILLSGRAGSGKTTVITHWLVLGELDSGIKSQLFVTLSRTLKDFSKDVFEQMLPYRYVPITYFKTFEQLLKETSEKGGLKPREQSKKMTFERFMREYARKVAREVDPALLWDETRSVIKGGCTEPSKRILDYSTYEKLSERRGQCKTPRKLREVYYDEAQKYQSYLDREGLWDEIDLARDCLSFIDRIGERYDRIACDEVQDLAPIEIFVLVKLVKEDDIDNMFFTGDTAQVINPSGFSWSKLKGILGEFRKNHEIRDPIPLKRDYRNTCEMVNLVNGILSVKKDILGDLGEEKLLESSRRGIKPVVLKSLSLEKIKNSMTDPTKRLILTKRNDKKEKIRELLGEACEKVTILTCEEAKGLEFDGILLWNFFVPRHENITKNDWKTVFIPKKREAFKQFIREGRKNPYALAYEFNLLHVGLTRAKVFLFVYDEDPTNNILGLDGRISEYTTQTDDLPVDFWKTAPPDPRSLVELASDLISRDELQARSVYKLAAREYEKSGDFRNAAGAYKNAKEFLLAAGCYEKLSDAAMQEKMLAYDSDSKKEWIEAGGHWERFYDNLDRARDLMDYSHRAAEAYKKAAEVNKSAELFIKAAKACQKVAGKLRGEKEIEYVRKKALLLDEAAECLKRGELFNEAIRTLQSAIETVRGEIIASNKEIMVRGERPEIWVAERFGKLADFYSEDPITAAQKMIEAAGYYHLGGQKSKRSSEKRTYLDKETMCRESASKFYGSVEKTDLAIDALKQAVEVAKANDLRDKTPRLWENLLGLLKSANRVSDYHAEAIEYVNSLISIGKKDQAAEIAKEGGKWCRENSYFTQAVELLGIAKKVYKETRRHKELAEVIKEIGLSQDGDGKLEESISSSVDAGRSYLKARMIKEALDCFEIGELLTDRKLSKLKVGMYCLKDVAIESLVPGNCNGEAREWINKAAGYFAGNVRRSVTRIETQIRDWEHKKKTEKCGWAYYCLWLLYNKATEKGVALSPADEKKKNAAHEKFKEYIKKAG